jgi:hypothetical protein
METRRDRRHTRHRQTRSVLAVVASIALLAACIPTASHSTTAALLACFAAVATVVSIGWFTAAMSRGGGLDALVVTAREWAGPRVTPLVGALGGAPIDPFGDERALVPTRYELIGTLPPPRDERADRPFDGRFWSRRTPMSQRHGARLVWAVLFVVYVYLALFALVVLFSIVGK